MEQTTKGVSTLRDGPACHAEEESRVCGATSRSTAGPPQG